MLAAAALVLFLWLGTRGLNEPDEGRFAEIGREMALQDSWLVPHLNGIPHFQKPPLLYWMTAGFIKVLGVNEWAVRLPSALAALGTIACTMFIAGLLFGAATRWVSGLILLTSVLFAVLARVATTDMLFTFWITASVGGLAAYVCRRNRIGLIAFYLCMGLAFLTKGPLGILIPASAAIAWQAAFRRSTGQRARLFWAVGFPLALAIGLSWFVAICLRYPALYDYFGRYEFTQRIATNVHGRHQPFWFFVPVLAGGFLPWTFFLPAVAMILRRRGTWSEPTLWLFAGWLAIPFVVLSCVSSKLATYVLPLLPPLALAVSGVWREACGTTLWRRSARVALAVLILCVVAFPAGALVANVRLGYRIALGFPVWGTVVMALGLLVAGFRMAGSDRTAPRVLPLLAGGFLCFFLALVSQADSILQGSKATMRDVARRIREEQSSADVPVFVYGRAHGVEFYTGRFVARNREASDVVLPMNAGQASRVVEDPSAFIKALADGDAFVVVKERRCRRDPAFAGWHVLMRAGASVLVSPCRHDPPCPEAIVPPASSVPPPSRDDS